MRDGLSQSSKVTVFRFLLPSTGTECLWPWMEIPMPIEFSKCVKCVICRWASQIRRSVCALVHMPAYPILHFIQSNITLAVSRSKTRRRVRGLGVGVGRRTNREVYKAHKAKDTWDSGLTLNIHIYIYIYIAGI